MKNAWDIIIECWIPITYFLIIVRCIFKAHTNQTIPIKETPIPPTDTEN